MKAEELFEIYKNFNIEEKIEFDKLYHKFQEERFSYINSKLHKRFIKSFFPIEYVNNFKNTKE